MINLKQVTVNNPNKKATYPFMTPLFQKGFSFNTDSLITILVGDNGIGKSTLLESLASKIGFPSFGGSADHRIMASDINKVIKNAGSYIPQNTFDLLENNRDYYSIDNLELTNNLQLKLTFKSNKGLFIRSETFANLVSLPRFSAEKLSHGEGILKILNDISSDGIYILDEPEAGLSPIKIITLMNILKEKSENYGAQFIIATHNPILMCQPNAKLIEITSEEIQEIKPEESEHFILTKRILNNKDEFFKRYLN